MDHATRALLRHFLGALAYRTQEALPGARAGLADLRAAPAAPPGPAGAPTGLRPPPGGPSPDPVPIPTPPMIDTPRLRLVPATPDMLRADLEGPAALAGALGVEVPTQWPPELYDAGAIQWTLTQVQGDPEGWYLHYFVRKSPGGGPEELVGVGGYKGGPRNGTVELGYSVLERHRRQGYAGEAVDGMVARAFSDPRVERVIAHTLPGLTPSIGVLERCGFRFAGPAGEEEDEEGAVAYELRRAGS